MQTNNSKPTPRVNEDTERLDEVTGGYSDYEHDRAAKRIMADIRNMPQRVEGHTPGPWAANGCRTNRSRGHDVIMVGSVTHPGNWIAEAWEPLPVGNDDDRIAIQHANARLIASAPDLLAACQRVLRAIEWGTTADRMDSAEQAELLRAAIARATNGGGM